MRRESEAVGSRRPVLLRELRAAPILLIAALTLLCAPGGLRAQTSDEGQDDNASDSDPFGRKSLSPKFSLHGFADVTLGGERFNDAGEDPSGETAFAIGALDLFINSRLAENISFLGETVFERERSGKAVVDVERLSIKYALSDRFWIALGRHHTGLGYWNETFHHGLFFQPTVERPQLLKFEDDGGILPVHSVGLALGGRWFRGPWSLDYSSNIGNGRGRKVDEVQNGSDANDNKAVTLKLTCSREEESRFLFGVMGHSEIIPADPEVPGREGEIHETIVGGHFAYRSDRLEVLAEYYTIHHEDRWTGVRFNHPAWYLVGVWRIGKWKPYAGLDRLDLDDQDPFFGGTVIDVRRYLAGVRLDVNPFHALKLEYRREDRSGAGVNALFLQAGFTF